MIVTTSDDRSFDLPFVLCFPVYKDKVLLLQRVKEPWLGKWNGAGGKIEPGEHPRAAIIREMYEETKLDFTHEPALHFAGVVSWGWTNKENPEKTPAMFVFVAALQHEPLDFERQRETPDGILAWKPLSWVVSSENSEVADNIPKFLPEMLTEEKPSLWHCLFEGNHLLSVEKNELPSSPVFESLYKKTASVL